MKTRSNALYAYLQQTGALNSTPEAFALAKREYRRLYKKQWAQRKQKSKELRITITQTQFEVIASKAIEQDMKHTVYVRSIILQAVGIHDFPISRQQLQQVLQLVSMAVVGLIKRTHSKQQTLALLEQAEQKLLTYLNKDDHGK